MNKFSWWAAVGGLALIAGASGAQASTIEMVENAYTVSTQGAVSINSLDLASAGTLTVTMTDLAWPRPLADTSFQLSSPTGLTLGSSTGFGTETYQITGPETVYALAFGQAAPLPGLAIGFGTYGLSINFEPASVPLPAAAGLLVSGLGLLGVAYRRRRRVAVGGPGCSTPAAE
jgi:hypothetical protein